jgi:hypothetical protein
MKKEIPLLIVFVAGLFMAIQFFVPHGTSEFVYEFVMDWTIIIGIFALALGIYSLIRVSVQKIQRKTPNWPYAFVVLGGLGGMIFFGLGFMGGVQSYMFRSFFNNVMIPLHATMFSLLAFFIASAAFRAFRARSALATVLLISAVVLMLRFNPYMGPLGKPDADLAQWILNVPNLAAKRAIIIGIGLGMVATALKVILGIERSYMGSD